MLTTIDNDYKYDINFNSLNTFIFADADKLIELLDYYIFDKNVNFD